MKILIGIVLCFSLISCEHISAPTENQHSSFHLRQDSYPISDSLFFLLNATPVDLGVVILRNSDSTIAYLSVPDSGTYSAHLLNTPISCAINGQSLVSAVPIWIQVNEHTRIHATWNENVVVVDRDEQN